ncbi:MULTISPECIES: GNAT family N-acetyltransferase [Pontibacillus]|uniref:GNAT family protein n=1 Tax=Pontibacillus chungwhensis TaxID=265426 RepID=A0ABY8V0A6_9BACI|nr:GNAT family protein [Pontibacillus chungwhensis]MCD5324643.1 GNAT family N-acetyltransferase [Pontibacillus sp. HN14]WIF99063.1 GNAT family protein [Pontibacillus chungwhensis]
MIFETERIRFRKLEKDDMEILHRWQNDTTVHTNMSTSIDLYSMEDVEKFYERMKDSRSYIIVEKESDKEIGSITLVRENNQQQNAEFLLLIGEKEYWGNGYGKEALLLFLNFVFMELNLHRISLKVFSFNEKAKGMYERMGFKVEGQLREAFFRNGKWHDLFIMGMLQDEYMALYK